MAPILFCNFIQLVIAFVFLQINFSTSQTFNFIAVPRDGIVFKAENSADGFAVLDCVFSPNFHGVSWQYAIVNDYKISAGGPDKSKWSDVFIDDLSHKLLRNNSLKISHWTDNYSRRRYRCIGQIRNWGSVISPPCNVDLASEPSSEAPGETEQVKEYEGGLLKLFCPIDANPKPMVEWYKDDIKMETSSRITLMEPSSFSSAALEISNLQLRDQGLYACEGTNNIGTKSVYVAQVDVIKGHTTEGLSFFEAPTNISTLIGDDVLLQCAARGFPTSIKYTWYRENVQLQESEYDIVGSGNVKLKNVDLKDSGSYKCIATFTGMVQAKSQHPIYLQVNESPKFLTLEGPSIQLEGEEEGNIDLSCPVTAHPAPTVSWYVDGKPVKMDGVYFVQQPDSLQVFGLLTSDANVYECIAENDYGTAYRVFHLAVNPRVPINEFQSLGKPRFLDAEPSSITSIHLSWEPPLGASGSQIVRYLISYYEDKVSSPRVKKVTTLNTKLSVDIGSLQEDTTYVFKVQGVNAAEKLGKTAEIRGRTLKRTHLGAIKVNIQTVESVTALINWGVQSPGYEKFYIEYLNSCFTPSPVTTRITTTSNSYLLKDLQENCLYNVTVSSENDQRQVAMGSNWFQTNGARPASPPQEVGAMGIDPNQIEVWWENVQKVDENGRIKEYLIKYRPQKLKADVNTEKADLSQKNRIVLKNLQKDAMYQVSVAAVNDYGDGPFSDWVSVKTLRNMLAEDRVPGKIERLTVVGVTENSLTIKWDGTEDSSKIRVRSYVLYIDQTVPITVTAEIAATENRYTFSGLKTDQFYIIKVAAKNRIGIGQYALNQARTSKTQDKYDMPLQMPNNVSVKAVGHDTLQVYFTSNNPTKDDSWFKVRVTCRYPTIFNREFKCLPLTSCHVTNLRPGTEYEIDVQAFRGDEGDPDSISSPWSMAALGSTDETLPGTPPMSLTASPVKGRPNDVLLMWLGPEEPNGQITGYDLFYTTDPLAEDWALDQIMENKLTHQVKDLTLETTYYFKIAARNRKGLGPPSATPISYSTPLAYNVPKDDLTNGAQVGSNSGGLEKEYVYIMIAAVVGLTVIVVCLIIAFVVCRIINHQAAASVIDKQSVGRPGSNLTQPGSLYSKHTPLQQPDLTDLYVHKDNLMELKPGKEVSVSYMSAGYRPMDNYNRSGSPPDIQKQHIVTSKFSHESPAPNFGHMISHSQGHGNPSPGMQMHITHPDMPQHGNLIRPTPVRLGGQLPPPLQQHPHSMQSEVPMMAIKPMFMQSNTQSPPHLANSPNNFNNRGSSGMYKHYESDTPTLGDYNTGSETAVYSPPSSLSGGNRSNDGSLGRRHKSTSDKALKALPAMPPELKPLSSLNATTGLPSNMMVDNNMCKMNKPMPLHPNLPSVSNSVLSSLPTSSYNRPLMAPPPGAPHMPPTESYLHSAMQQEADACVDKIAGLMNRLNSQNVNHSYQMPHGRMGEMDC